MAIKGSNYMAKQESDNDVSLGFASRLWAVADKLRGHMEPSDYKHVALDPTFLKYISDAFEAKRADLLAEELADLENPEEYLAENVFRVPQETRWSHLRARDRKAECMTQVFHNTIVPFIRGMEARLGSRSHLTPRSRALSANAKNSEPPQWR